MYPMTSDSFCLALTGSQLRDTLLPSWIHSRFPGGCAGAGWREQEQNCGAAVPPPTVLRAGRHYSRALLVRALTGAVAGPWPMLLKPLTAT